MALVPFVHAQWTPLSIPTTTNLYSVHASDTQHWAIGGTSRWIQSDDGGNTWQSHLLYNEQSIQLLGLAINAIDRHSTDTLFMAGAQNSPTYPLQLWRSTNTGANWDLRYDQAGNGAFSQFLGMAWRGALGFAVGAEGRIIRTTDLGTTWSTQLLGGDGLYDIVFADAQTMVIAGYGRILRSTDAGQNWTTVFTTTAELDAVHFPTPLVGYAGGVSGQFLKTTDGGLTWQSVFPHLAVNPRFRDLWFASTDEGYALMDQEILHTTDGGVHWEHYSCASTMHQFHFQSPTLAVAVGEQGHAYRLTGTGTYHPYALVATFSNGLLCPGSTRTFTSVSDPALTHQWSINGVPASNGLSLEHTFNVPLATDTVMLLVSNGAFSDSVSYIIHTGDVQVVLLDAELVRDTLCRGGSTQVHVLNSQGNTQYTLRRGSTAIGAMQLGTGGTLTFNTGTITAFDTLNVIARRPTNDCGILLDSLYLPIALGDPHADLLVTPTTATACQGDVLPITVAASQPGVNYQLRRNTTNVGAVQAGTGSDLVFSTGPMQASAVYTLHITNTSTGCVGDLAQTVPVTLEIPHMAWGTTTNNPYVGTPVDLMNTSDAVGGSFAWAMPGGAPSTSTAVAPTGIVFATPGPVPVQLVATTPAGCRDTLVHVLHVIAPPADAPCSLAMQSNNGGGLLGPPTITFDADNNMYSYRTVDRARASVALSGLGDTLTVPGSTNIINDSRAYLMKYDPNGVAQWAVEYRNVTNWTDSYGDVKVDPAGNSYVMCFRYGSWDTMYVSTPDGARTTIPLPTQGSYFRSALITSFDPQGRLRWYDTFFTGYGSSPFHLALDGLGGLIAQAGDRLVRYDQNTGAELWEHYGIGGYYSIAVTSDHKLWEVDADALVMRKYDVNNTLLLTTPTYTYTWPDAGLPRLTTFQTTRDAADNLYQFCSISGQVVIGNDTLSGDNQDELGLPNMYFLARRTAATGAVAWTHAFSMRRSILFHGMAVANGRCYATLSFMGPDTLRMDGLQPIPVHPTDLYLLSTALDGSAPSAVPIAVHPVLPAPTDPYLPGDNGMAASPAGDRLAFWVPFSEPYAYGSDMVTPYTGFAPNVPFNTALLFGEVPCVTAGLSLAPVAYFPTPQNVLVGQPIAFTDASLYGPTAWSWSFPGASPASSTSNAPVVTYAVPGTYTVTLTCSNANGTSVPYTATIVVAFSTGVEAATTAGTWSLWPTVANEAVQLQGGTGSAPAHCVDAQGRVVWRGTVRAGGQLPVGTWPAGAYALVIEAGDARACLRFVVGH